MIKIPGTLRDMGQMVDGTRKIMIYTQEVSPEDLFEVLKYSGQLGYFVFSPTAAIQEEDIPTTPLEDNQKTPSQRLRAVMFVYWNKRFESGQDKSGINFDTFYAQQVEKYIDLIKKKIDEI